MYWTKPFLTLTNGACSKPILVLSDYKTLAINYVFPVIEYCIKCKHICILIPIYQMCLPNGQWISVTWEHTLNGGKFKNSEEETDFI